MSPYKPSPRRWFYSLAAASCLLTGFPATILAESNPGLIIFGGPNDKSTVLDYYLDFGGKREGWDRYRLRIPSKKMDLGVSKFVINVPKDYDGKFDTNQVEVLLKDKDKAFPVQEVTWDQENRRLEIYLQGTLEANNSIEIVLSNVKNPIFGGMFYFDCNAVSPGDVPLPRYVGTWILSIN